MEKVNEKLLFAGPCYYPRGGMNDLVFSGTEEECIAYFTDNQNDIGYLGVDNWGQIVDRATLVVEKWGRISDEWIQGKRLAGVAKWYAEAVE